MNSAFPNKENLAQKRSLFMTNKNRRKAIFNCAAKGLFFLAESLILIRKFIFNFYGKYIFNAGYSRGKTSSSCTILFPIYLKRRILQTFAFKFVCHK